MFRTETVEIGTYIDLDGVKYTLYREYEYEVFNFAPVYKGKTVGKDFKKRVGYIRKGNSLREEVWVPLRKTSKRIIKIKQPRTKKGNTMEDKQDQPKQGRGYVDENGDFIQEIQFGDQTFTIKIDRETIERAFGKNSRWGRD